MSSKLQSAPGQLCEVDACLSMAFTSDYSQKTQSTSTDLQSLPKDLSTIKSRVKGIKDIIVLMNNEDHGNLLRSVAQIRSVQPYIHKQQFSMSSIITEIVQKPMLDRSVWVCISNLNNNRWLGLVIELVTMQRQSFHNQGYLEEIFGLRLLLCGDVLKDTLPKELLHVVMERVVEPLTPDGVRDLENMFLAHMQSRNSQLTSRIETDSKELFLYMNIHLKHGSTSAAPDEDIAESYKMIIELLEDSASLIRQYIQQQFKMPHVAIIEKMEPTHGFTLEIRPTTLQGFAMLIDFWKRDDLGSLFVENIKLQRSEFACVVNIEINGDHIMHIQQMLKDEQITREEDSIDDILESRIPVGIVKNCDPSETVNSVNTFTAKGVKFFSKLYQDYLNDKKRAPAEFLRLLRQQKCSWHVLLKIRDQAWNPAMHMTVLAGREDFLDMFLYLGLWGMLRQQIACPVVEPDSVPPTNTGYTARRVAESLSYKNTWQALFRKFVKCDAIWRGLAPLSRACSTGDILMSKALIATCPRNFPLTDAALEECLVYACGSGNIELVKFLLDTFSSRIGNLPSFMHGPTERHRCVDVAAMLGHTDIIWVITGKMKINKDSEALEMCALNGDTVGADILIEHGKRWSPSLVMLAAKKSQEGFIKHVFDKKPDINVNEGMDENGQNALHFSAMNGAVKLLTFLILKKADISAVDKYGRNVLHLAVAANHVEATEMLINEAKNVGCLDQMINQNDFFVGKDIYYIIRGKEKGVKAWHWVKLKRLMLYTFDLALKRGQMELAKFGLVLHSGFGSTPHERSIKRVKEEQDELLKNQHKDLTPLHVAVSQQNLPLVQLLLRECADPNSRDHFHATPAHFAAMVGSVEILEVLVTGGADIQAKTYDNKTPADVAQENDQTDVMNFIEAGSVISKAGDFTKHLDSTSSKLSEESLDGQRNSGHDLQRYIVDSLRDLTIDINIMLEQLHSGPVMEESS